MPKQHLSEFCRHPRLEKSLFCGNHPFLSCAVTVASLAIAKRTLRAHTPFSLLSHHFVLEVLLTLGIKNVLEAKPDRNGMFVNRVCRRVIHVGLHERDIPRHLLLKTLQAGLGKARIADHVVVPLVEGVQAAVAAGYGKRGT